MAKITGDKYELEYRASDNVMYIKVWGFYMPEDAMAFIKDYSTETQKFIPSKTTLIIDSVGLKTSKPEAKILLVECLKLYMNLTYKNRLFLKSTSPTANIMIKNAMREAGMEEGRDGSFMDSMSEIEDYIKSNLRL
jgi:hypothetical protein